MAFLLIIISLVARVSFGALLCNVRIDGANGTSAKFNLAPYVLDELSITNDDYWCVKDSLADSDTNRNYSYCFNLCRPVLEYPTNEDWLTNMSHCKPGTIMENGYCPDDLTWNDCHENITARTLITGKAWAYQIRNNARLREDERDCWRLSDERGGAPPVWSFYDEKDPTAGVKINYKHGEYAQGCHGNRELILIFKCSNDRFQIPRSEPVTEIIDRSKDADQCGKYQIEIESIYGCPSICSSSRSICNGRGLCGYDYGINAPKCFCFQEYGGDSCEGFSDIIFQPSKKAKPDLTNDLVFDFEPTFVGIDQDGDVFERDVELIYDLQAFGVDPDEYYVVNDSAAYGQWVFYIGIGNPVDTQYLPESCEVVDSPCMDYDFVNKKCNHEIGSYMYNDTAYVYQYSARGGDCSLLGSVVGTTQLIDDVDDFAKGVRMTYIGGSYGDGCQTPNKNRIFHINFVCPNSNSFYNWGQSYNFETHAIEFTTLATEDNACEYEITIENPLACPYQCITNNHNGDIKQFAVCSGHGKCAADPIAGFVRCICDTGYKGDQCETSYTESPTTISPSKNPSPSPSSAPSRSPTNVGETYSPSNNPSVSPIKSSSETIIIQENDKTYTGLLAAVIILAVLLILVIIFGCWKYNRDVHGKASYSLGSTVGDGKNDTEMGGLTQY